MRLGEPGPRRVDSARERSRSPAVEGSGGKFYPAGDEQAVLNAIKDIDSRSAGRVEVKRYSTQRPKFAPYAFMATAFWSIALVLQLTVPYFRKFP